MISPRFPTFSPSAAASMPVSARAATDREQHVVRLERFRRAVLLGLHEHAILLDGRAGDFRSGANIEALLAEHLVGFLDDVGVHARKNRRHELDDRHLRAEPTPDRSELEADHAAADDDEVLRHFADGQRADVRQHAPLVDLEERQLDRHRAGRDDDVLRLVRRDRAVGAGDVDDVAGARACRGPSPTSPCSS